MREDAAIWVLLAAESEQLADGAREDLRLQADKLSPWGRWSIEQQLEQIDREDRERRIEARLRRSDLPREPQLDIVIRRRLARAGYWLMHQLRGATETEIADVHGIGPKAIEQLRPIVGWEAN